MPGKSDLPLLIWMDELPVAALLVFQLPAIAAKHFQHVADLHIYFPSRAA